jgi:hypothetical protein
MGKERTEKSQYLSGYGGGYVTAPQYITELVCAKFAKQTLPEKFWQIDKYKKTWGRYAKEVNILLKQYPAQALISGLRDRRLNRLRSIHAKAAFMWKPVFDWHKRKLEAAEKVHVVEKEDDVPVLSTVGRPPMKKTGLFGDES